MSNARTLADMIVGTEIKLSNVDSDLSNKINSIKTRLDSDDAKLQSLDVAIANGLLNLVDSDLIINQLQAKITNVVANNDSDSAALQAIKTRIISVKTSLDSDDTKLQSISTNIAAEISATNTDISGIISRLDSDEGKLQSLDTNLVQIRTRLDSDETAIQALKTLAISTASSVGITDSDLKVVADLRNNLDSEIISIRALNLTYVNYTYNATAGQTTFTGSDANSLTLAYVPGSIQVFMNGIKLEVTDYTATDGTSIVLSDPAFNTHQISIIVSSIKSTYIIPPTDYSQLTQQTKLVASDAATQHWLGQAVAISEDGNTAIISAEQENTTATKSGAIYVFVRSGSTWTQQAKLKASDPGTENNLGRSLDISDDGNTVVAGAPFNGSSATGAIYVWTRTGSTWSSATKIRGSDTTVFHYFGFGCSISGDGLTIAAGAMEAKKGYIFVYSGGSWSQQAVIANPTGGTHNSSFGNKCALSQDGNTMVMTARSDHALANDFDGAAYVFVRAGTNWSMQQKIQASIAEQSAAKFGESCDMSWDGNTIAIGAHRCNTNSGAVFVFTRSGTTWTQEQKIQPTDIAQQDLFAINVGISGDGNTIVAGSYSEDNGSKLSAGALYAFSRSGTTWSQEIKLYSSDSASNDEFGYGVAIAKDNGTVIAGARFEDASGVRSGSAYVFTA